MLKYFSYITKKPKGLLILTVCCLLGLFIFWTLIHYKTFEKKQLQYYAFKLEKEIQKSINELHKQINDKTLQQKIKKGYWTEKDLKTIAHKDICIMGFEYGLLKFWTGETHIPPYNGIVDQKDSIYTLTYKDHVALAVTKKIDSTNIQMLGVKDLYHNYHVDNNILKTGFTEDLQIPGFILITDENKDQDVYTVPIRYNGKKLFDIFYNEKIENKWNGFFYILILGLLISLYFLLFRLAHVLLKENKYATKYMLLVIVLSILMFVITIKVPTLLNLTQFFLFDPSVYSYSKVFNSLWVLIMFNFLFLSLTYFVYQYLKSVKNKYVIHFLLLTSFCVAASFLQGIFLINSMVKHSKISLNLTTTENYQNFNIVGVVIIILSQVILYYWINIHERLISKLNKQLYTVLFNLLPIAIITTVFILAKIGLAFMLPLILMVLIMLYALYLHKRNKSHYTIKHLLMFIVSMSFSIMLIVSISYYKFENENMVALASELSDEKDLMLEYTLSNNKAMIEEDNIFKYYLLNPYNINGSVVMEKLSNNYVSSYLNPFEVNLYIFDKDNYLLEGTKFVTWQAINEKSNNNKNIKIENGIYKIKNKENKQEYLCINEIKAEQKLLGYIVLEIIPKNTTSNSVYPDLLLEDKLSKNRLRKNYSYAVYYKNQLIKSQGEYIFNTIATLQKPTIYFNNNQPNINLFYPINENSFIHVNRKQSLVQYGISTFTLWFLMLLSLCFILYLIDYFKKVILYKKNIYNELLNSFHHKILFAFIVLLISTISVAALVNANFYIKQSKEKTNTQVQIKANEIKEILNETFINRLDTISNVNVLNNNISTLQSSIKDIAKSLGVDINIYDNNGELIAATQADIFNKGIIPQVIHSLAYYYIEKQHKQYYSQKEIVGNMTYLSAYIPLNNANNEAIGIINIPYFDEQKQQNFELSNFIISSMNFYGVIVLIGVLFSILLSQQVTESLRVVGKSLNRIKLGSTNERLTWTGDDEIKELVNQYNSMLSKLEESAKNIADNERDLAWREMAKQVAHEIKNPLTPMKLNLQYLQKAIADDNDNIKQLSQKFTANLIEQIDLLTNIATQFSTFAQMPKAKYEH